MLRNVLLMGLFAAGLATAAAGCCVDACGMRRGALGRRLPGPGDCMCGGHGCGMCGGVRHRFTDCHGCGEMYVDEWASDPPDCNDPCDDGMCGRGGRFGGHFGGCQTGCCGGGFLPLTPWRTLWGRRYSPGRYDYGFSPGHEMMYGEGEVIYEGPATEGNATPTPATKQTPTPAARQTQSAIKKSTARQPYYEQGHQHPQAMRHSPGSWHSAANAPYPMSGRVMR